MNIIARAAIAVYDGSALSPIFPARPAKPDDEACAYLSAVAEKLMGSDGAHYQNYRVLMMWNSDHPYSAARCFGGSVKTYFMDPSIAEIEKAYRAHGRARVPHLLYDRHPVTGAHIKIPCTQRMCRESESFSMVTAAALVMNWLSAMTAGKYRESAYTAFCED